MGTSVYIWIGDHQVSRQNMSGMFQMAYLSDTKEKEEFKVSHPNLWVIHHLTQAHISTLRTIPTVVSTLINLLTGETQTVILKNMSTKWSSEPPTEERDEEEKEEEEEDQEEE